MNQESLVFSALILGVALLVGSLSFVGVSTPPPPCGFGCPPRTYLSYQPCITGYSGFQVTRQFPNPSTWTFELLKGATGYLYYSYNVTKGIDYFVKFLAYPWTMMQTYPNGSDTLVIVNGSRVIHVQYDVLNQFPAIRPNDSYPLPVQLSLAKYSVRGSLVNATWTVTGLLTGTYQIESGNLEWHTIVVAPSTETANATSETFSGSCGGGGTVNFNG